MTAVGELQRGDKQTVALTIINGLTKGKETFEDLTAEVGKATGLDEPGARHLIRYLVKYQDVVDSPGKKKTLRDQGRIIEGCTYNGKNSNGVPDATDEQKGWRVLLIAAGPNGRKKPETAATSTKTVTETKAKVKETKPASTEKRGTPERAATIAAAAKRLSAKRATAVIEKLAAEGAHHFSAGETVALDLPKPEALEDAEDTVDETEKV